MRRLNEKHFSTLNLVVSYFLFNDAHNYRINDVSKTTDKLTVLLNDTSML